MEFLSRGIDFSLKRMGLIFLLNIVRFFSLKFDIFIHLSSTVSFKTTIFFPPIRIIYRELIKFISLGFQVEFNIIRIRES